MKKIILLLTLFTLIFHSNLSAQHVVLDQQFEDYKVVYLESRSFVEQIENKRSDILRTKILDYDLQLYNSDIISPSYEMIIADQNGTRVIDTKVAKPMKGSTRSGGKVSLTFNDNFIYGF